MDRASLHQIIVGMALVASGMVAGAVLSTSKEAHGEIRGTPPPPTFQSGGQLSVPVLREMASTLHQIDARLARLEAVAQKLQTTRPTNHVGN